MKVGGKSLITITYSAIMRKLRPRVTDCVFDKYAALINKFSQSPFHYYNYSV